jgi:apoptosis-inducing factor 3
MGGSTELKGPDLGKDGVAAADLADNAMLEGHASGKAVLLVRRDGAVFAVGALCTHYGAPLADGVLTGDVVRCPWHHAVFDLRNGDAVAGPALDPVPCWTVEQRDGRIFVAGRREQRAPRRLALVAPRRVVVVGAGAAGACAVETLRREGYDGELALVGREDSVPVDRPNLSKDYLAGTAPEEWIPLRAREFYAEHKIDLRLGVAARAIDTALKAVELANGTFLPYDALLLATGAEPVRLPIPGSDLEHVYTLRSLADSRAIIARAAGAKRAVVLGASFIGLEVAASLRARGLEVDVVAPDEQPLARVLGEVGAFVRGLHEAKGVRFHLGRKPASIAPREVTLDDGARLACDLCVMGVGVRPASALAEAARIAVDGGILTDEYLETSVPGVFAAGDVARYATGRGTRQRVEHWVHAGRQGQVAAQNILGRRRPFTHVPFFWSAHYDVTINYVGHAEAWDAMQIAGSLDRRDATIAYRAAGAIRAVATIGRDRVSLMAEEAMERGDVQALEALMKEAGEGGA